MITIILVKAYNQPSQREAQQFCQKAPISVLILRSLPSLFITLGTTPAILSKITQLSSFSALPTHSILVFLLHLPQLAPLLPLFHLISQSTTNPAPITEVMEVVLSLLVLLLSLLCQYFNSSDLIYFFAGKHFYDPGEFTPCLSLLPLLYPLFHPLVFVTFGQTFHPPFSVFLFSLHPENISSAFSGFSGFLVSPFTSSLAPSQVLCCKHPEKCFSPFAQLCSLLAGFT